MKVTITQLQSLLYDVQRVLDDHAIDKLACESMLARAERVHHLITVMIDAIPSLEINLPLIKCTLRLTDDTFNGKHRRDICLNATILV